MKKCKNKFCHHNDKSDDIGCDLWWDSIAHCRTLEYYEEQKQNYIDKTINVLTGLLRDNKIDMLKINLKEIEKILKGKLR